MDYACADKLLEVFDEDPEEVGEIIQCLRGERLQYLFDTTRGLSDRDFLNAILVEYATSPRCISYSNGISIIVLASVMRLADSKAICSREHSREMCLSDHQCINTLSISRGLPF